MIFKYMPLFRLNRNINFFKLKRFVSIFAKHLKSDQIIGINKSLNHFNSRQLNEIQIKYLSSKVDPLANHKLSNERFVAKTLINCFNLKEEEVKTIFENYSGFKQISVNDLQNIISLLEFKQLSSPELATKRPWILLTDKLTLTSGLNKLQKYRLLNEIRNGKTYIFCVFLVDESLSSKSFSRQLENVCKRIKSNLTENCFVLFSDFDERMDYFCNNLDINCETFCSVVRSNFGIIRKDMNHIKSVMQLLKQNGVSNEDLLRDHWIFLHNISLMEKRIEECKQSQYPIGTWLLRCPDPKWYPLLKRWKEDMEVLGSYNDKKTYLTQRLNCRLEDIDYLVVKNHRLLTIRPKKLEEIITYLYQKGYSSSDIRNFPRVLSYNIDRIKRRLQNHNIPCNRHQLNIIYKSEKEYNQLMVSSLNKTVP